MKTSRRTLDDAAAERLLRGRSVDGSPELEPVVALVGALHRLEDAAAPAPRGELAALLTEGFDPEHLPTPAADVPLWRPEADARHGLLRHPATRLAGLSLVAKVLLGSGVAVAGVTTAAGTGTLPDPVQDRVSEIVEAVTPFEVPRGHAPVTPPGTGTAGDGRPAEQPGDRASTPAVVPPATPQPPARPAPPRQTPPETAPVPAPPAERPEPGRTDRGPKQSTPGAEQAPDRVPDAPAAERRAQTTPTDSATQDDTAVEQVEPPAERAQQGPADEQPGQAGPAAG